MNGTRKKDDMAFKKTVSRQSLRRGLLLLLLVLNLSAPGCKREERGFRVAPPQAESIDAKALSDLQPGPKSPPAEVHNEYEENAYAMAAGKNLFEQNTCSG